MKKILIFSPDFFPVIGGAEVFAYKLANYFSSIGEYHVTVLTRYPTSASSKLNCLNKIKYLEIKEKLTVIRSPYFEIVNYRILSSIPSLLLLLNALNLSKKFDTIHYIGFFPSAILHKFLFKLKKQKFIYTEQGMIVDVIRNGKNIYNTSPGFLKEWYVQFFNSVDFIVAVSNNVKNKLSNYTYKKIYLISNGIESIGNPKVRNKNQNKFTILTSSRLVEKNNIYYLVKEFHQLLINHKFNINMCLNIYGDGEERKKIEQYIIINNLTNYINLFGTISHSDMLDVYKGADLFIRPSLTEGFGISFIEALSTGVPVIGSISVEKLGTYNTSCGSSIVSYSPGELIALIEKYYFDTNFYNNQSISAVEYSKNFLWSSIFKKYNDYYKA